MLQSSFSYSSHRITIISKKKETSTNIIIPLHLHQPKKATPLPCSKLDYQAFNPITFTIQYNPNHFF